MLSNKIKKKYLKYYSDLNKLVKLDDKQIINLEYLKKLLNAKKEKKEALLGNGGSAAIASHFAADLNNVKKDA